jgi:aminotransferase
MRNFVSERVQQVPSSGIRRFFDIAATMTDVISLGIGEPDFVTPEPFLRAGIRSLEQGETHYTSNAGILELRQAVACYLEHLYGVSYDPEDELAITVGVSEAMYLAVCATINPGDEVIIPEPCFVSYAPEVIFAGGRPVMVPTRVEDDFQVTGATVEAAVTPRTKAILIGYPNNPTGAVMTRERLEEVAAVARQHDLLVISDEIYDRLVYGIAHTYFATLDSMRSRAIVLGGLSKSHAMTGWRLGWAAAPRDILAAMSKIHQYTIMSASTIAQVAAIEALNTGEEHVARMVAEYDRRRLLLLNGLNELGLTSFDPRGAFYVFPSVAASGMSDEQFAEALLEEEQVAVVPGRAFGPSGEGFVRCCYATAYEKLEQALEHLRRFMRRHG